jgi:DNA polymerase elongation subunit (family B)
MSSDGSSYGDEKIASDTDGEPDPAGPEVPALRYDAVSATIPGLLSRSDLVRRDAAPEELDRLEGQIAGGEPVHFLPVDVVEKNAVGGGALTYELHLFGPMPTGAKAHVIVVGVPVYFDVRVREWESAAGLAETLRGLLAESGLAPKSVHPKTAYPIHGWREAPEVYLRVVHPNLQRRSKAIRAVRNAGHETASDDLSGYYRAVARVHGLALADWSVLTGYRYARGGRHPAGGTPESPLCEHRFIVDLGGLRPLVDPGGEPAGAQAAVQADPALLRDKTLVLAWDIETHTRRPGGDLPRASYQEDTVFMIAVSVAWKGSAAPLYQACLVSAPTATDPRWATVVCADEGELLKAFAAVIRAFAPDVITGFNDGDYDWPFVLEKMRQRGLLSHVAAACTALPWWQPPTAESVERFDVIRDRPVKLGNDISAKVTCLKLPGYVPVDTRVMFRQLYPKAEVGKSSSLAFYLRVCGLGSKADMSHTRMWRIYEKGGPAQMWKVARYCVVDAQRCQELLVKRSVLAERREVATLSFVSFQDAVYQAGGHKVRNLVFEAAERRGFLCSAILADEASEERRKYPGAWVFQTRPGLVPDPTAGGAPALEAARAAKLAAGPEGQSAAAHEVRRALAQYDPGRPVTGLDFASLYPSIIIAYNFSPETYVATLEEARRLEAAGRELHEAAFEMQGEPVRGWFVRDRGAAPGPRGLYPELLAKLFRRRSALKAELAALSRELERQKVAAKGAPLGAEAAAEQRETGFRKDALDSKQKALKVLMNTFYGEAGNSRSALFLLPLAGGVTAAGKRCIQLAADFVQDRGYRLHAGDTDSLYLSCPAACFREADEEYAFGRLAREEYWAEQVRISMREMAALSAALNAHLVADTGGGWLRMEYEEVLFPAGFCAKKKYFGVAHVTEPNFHPDELFIRGIEVVRMGQSPLAREIGNRVMWQAVALENTRPLLEIVEEVLAGAVRESAQWSFADFVMTEAWKPDKDNKAVKRFVARMTAAAQGGAPRGPLPEPGERFAYVLCRPPAAFGLEGKRLALTKGDVMEFPEHARAAGLPLDIARYLESQVVGLCARFVGGHPRFQPETAPCRRVGEDAEKALERAARDAAVRHFKKHLAQLQAEAPEVLARQGYAYRRAWKETQRALVASAPTRLGPVAELFHSPQLGWELFVPAPSPDVAVESLAAEAARRAAVLAPGLAENVAARLGIGPDGRNLAAPPSEAAASRLWAIEPLLRPSRAGGRACRGRRTPLRELVLAELGRREAKARSRLAAQVLEVGPAALRYEAFISLEVDSARAREHAARPAELGAYSGAGGAVAPFALTPAESAQFEALRQARAQLQGVLVAKAAHCSLVAHLEALKNRRQGFRAPPPRDTIAATIARAASEQPPLGLPIQGGAI